MLVVVTIYLSVVYGLLYGLVRPAPRCTSPPLIARAVRVRPVARLHITTPSLTLTARVQGVPDHLGPARAPRVHAGALRAHLRRRGHRDDRGRGDQHLAQPRVRAAHEKVARAPAARAAPQGLDGRRPVLLRRCVRRADCCAQCLQDGAGIFFLGWTGAFASVPWWVPALATIIIGVSFTLIFISFLVSSLRVCRVL
jgi:hypothetical protein